MGRGNVCVFHPFETLFYFDKKNYSIYYLPEEDCCFLERDLEANGDNIEDCAYFEESSFEEFDMIIEQIQNFISEKIKSFSPVHEGKADDQVRYRDVSVFLENGLYQIGWTDNQDSIAFLLLQRTDRFGELKNGLCKRHFETYANVLKDALFEHTDELGIYDGAWTQKTIRKTNF